MRTVILPDPDDFDAWRDAARTLILLQVPPDQIIWQNGTADDLFANTDPLPKATGTIPVPRAFVNLAQSAICHSAPDRFSLLYTLLWRLQTQRALITDYADPLIRRIDDLAKSVRRDIHKMRAFVRFREVDGRYVAWFEPDHYVVRANAAFFVRRFASMQWSILTPAVSIHWDGKTLAERPGAEQKDAPDGDPVEDVWKSYYASIFNPARVKIGAMTKEMPKKYWKNMPETALIPGLIQSAQAREAGMIDRQTISGDTDAAWAGLRDEARGCGRCPLWKPASQTVFGEGPMDAMIMFVGEQPGDQEDLAGRPFVGPAGQIFDKALVDAGIDRTRAYVTNAVKHFKFDTRGSKRIHAKPGAGEIDACRWWLDQERAIIRPRLTVALGATAARSLFGRAIKIGETRGRLHTLTDGTEAWVTIHPSYLLRIENEIAAKAAYKHFVRDLKMIKHQIDQM
jgi:uracil-DNA glycosylase